PHISAELCLDVHDPIIPEQSGCYRLRVRDGRGHVERGGSAGLRLDIRALAALYTGFASPQMLHRTGQLSGDAASLTCAATLFAGAAPAMPDFF
nr:sterol carrier protein domain-containing protein [Polyangiaceae bacterium]